MKDSVCPKVSRQTASENTDYLRCVIRQISFPKEAWKPWLPSRVMLLLDKRIVKIVGQQIQEEMYSVGVSGLFKNGARN